MARDFIAARLVDHVHLVQVPIDGAAHLLGGLHIPIENGGAELCRGVVERNAEEGVALQALRRWRTPRQTNLVFISTICWRVISGWVSHQRPSCSPAPEMRLA